MKKRRVLSLLLAALMTSSAMLSTSCLKKEEKKEIVKAPAASSEDNGPQLVLPDIDGGGESFDVFIGYSVANSDWKAPEEETGDTIPDILYQRNKEVMGNFNVEFTVKDGITGSNSEGSGIIRSLIQAGDDTYEVFINVQHAGIPLIYEDLFVEWNESMPYANLENPWWYQNVQRDLNFGDKVYVTAGAYNYHCLRGAGVLAFNKTMLDELGLEYPYQLVLDGKWTVDRLLDYNRAAQKDLNGDGLLKPDDDRLGVAGWKWEMIPAFFIGMGGNPVTKNDSSMPELNVNNERTFNVIDRMIEIFDDGNGGFSNGETYARTGTMFKEGRLLFHDTTLDQLTGLREMEDDFGAIPYPKLDEDQESYYSRVVNYSSLTYVPVTNTKLELTSAILEQMAYISHRDLIPAFYDVILTIKTSRDTETEQMIDIVRSSARFMDENFLKSGTLISIVEGGTNTLSSNYAAQGDAWEARLEDIVEFWEK